MSTQTRTGGSGRNQKKINAGNVGGGGGDAGNNKKTDIPKTEKEKPQAKPTADQIRMAKLTDMDNGPEDPKMPEKVAILIEMTQRSEEEVCCALYECDNNLEKAVVFLLESLPVGAFEMSSKKKKNRVANPANEAAGETEWTDGNTNNDKREKSRNRSSTRGGRGGTDSRGWRGRESRENDRNASDSFQKFGGGEGGGYRGSRGRGGGGVGSGRGGYGGRGGRGGRIASRGMGSRDQARSNYSIRQPQEHQEVDTWDNTIAQNAEKNQQPQDDAWGDWDNEEYVGSLKDSKVFTPSNLQNISLTSSELPTPPGMDPQTHLTSDDLVQQYSTTVISNSSTAAAASGVGNGTTGTLSSAQFPDIHSSNAGHNLRLNNLQASSAASQQQLKSSATLSAEQSQYFNSLSSQNTPQQQANVNTFQNSTVQYPASYGAVFVDQSANSQPSVRRPRAKVPPPSKIPSTAVEMPVDTLNNIDYLDVQFGGLNFGTEESFDTLTEKFSATSIDNSQNAQSQDQITNDFQPKSNSIQQATLTAGLQNSQITDALASTYSQRSTGNVQPQNTVGTINTAVNSSLAEQLTKSDPYIQSNTPSATGGYQTSYTSNSSANKSASSYQPSGTGKSYNNSNYSNSQSSSANTYQPTSNNFSSYNPSSVHSYQQQTGGVTASNSASSVSGSTVSSSTTQNIPVGNSSTVNNSSVNSNAGYLTSQYQSNQTTSAYPSQQSAYQSSQSVYGGTGLANNTGYTGSTSTSSSQYSNFSNTKLKDTSTTSNSHFDSVSSVTSSSVVSSTISTVTSSTSTTNSMSSPSLGITKVTNSSSTATKNSAGMVPPNIQMVSQYIQTGMPYYQQPAVYSYEDLQVMQQRIPHVTQYFDINYTPTSLGAAGVRDANLGSVSYSTMTDGRFARNDNNSSPVGNQVSSTMSQQTGSSGPVLNVPYAYFYNGNMMQAGGFQYGTPAIYPQQMPATNATTGGQFPKPPYNSGYGATGYDGLNQNTQDYSKQYPGSAVSQQAKTQNVSNAPQAGTVSELSSSMYGGKGHVALNKVNSYDNKSYHSGTPPPYNLTGTQTAGATSAQPYGMYIQPMPPTHHNMGIHQPIHQDSNSTGQRQQSGSQSKSGGKQGYSPSYWAAQN